MDLDPTAGRPGAPGPTRTQTALATDARRNVTPPEVEREAVSRTTERAAYTSPGLRPAGEATRDVVVHLSQKALALAKSASNPPPRLKRVDHPDEGEEKTESPLHHDERSARWTKPILPRLSIRA